jgi:methylated-DNA-protein-cysteine methyltransferase-like protein
MSDTFTQRVYEIVSRIPAGKVATYSEVAALAGSPGAARAVGTAMKNNPDRSLVPCHRVVGADGSMHGYAFGEGVSTKRSLLAQEGAVLVDDKVDLVASHWDEE